MDQDPQGTAPRFVVNATASDHFSWLRTRLSVERTLLAWVRTSISLIGFGFTIVLFFERIADFYQVRPARFPQAPKLLGLSLIAMGVIILAIIAFEARKTNRYLRSGEFAKIAGGDGLPKGTPIYAVSLGLCLIGLFCFAAIFLKLI